MRSSGSPRPPTRVVENSKVGVMDRLGRRLRDAARTKPAHRLRGDPRLRRPAHRREPVRGMAGVRRHCAVDGRAGGDHGAGRTAGVPAGAERRRHVPGDACGARRRLGGACRQRTGEGQFLDVAMYDAILALCENMRLHVLVGGARARPARQRARRQCPFDVFPTSDGAIAIAAPTPNHWALLCAMIGRVET